jgi:hypothetical protein
MGTGESKPMMGEEESTTRTSGAAAATEPTILPRTSTPQKKELSDVETEEKAALFNGETEELNDGGDNVNVLATTLLSSSSKEQMEVLLFSKEEEESKFPPNPIFQSSKITHAEATDDSAGTGSLNSAEDEASASRESPIRTNRQEASGCLQILALLRKNVLTKRRTPTATFFELFSPLLMMLVLIAGYSLSKVVDKDSQMYSSITMDIPGPWLDLVRQGMDVSNPSRRRLRRAAQSVLPTDELEEENDWKDIFSGLQERMHRKLMMTGRAVYETQGHTEEGETRRLQFDAGDDDGIVEEGGGRDFNSVYDLLDEARRQVSKSYRTHISLAFWFLLYI